MSDMQNPFASILQNQGVLGSIGNQIWGKPLETRKLEAEFAERHHIRGRKDAAAQTEIDAQREILELAHKTREAMPGASTDVLMKTVVANPVFLKNVMRVPAEKMTKFTQDVFGAISPVPVAPMKPMVVGEGAALVNPDGTQLFKNEKPAEASPRTKAEHTELAKKSVASLDKVAEAGQQARMDSLAIEQLDALGERIGTGGAAAIRGFMARVGVDLGGASDIQAFESLVDRLTPAQRQGLPGAASDRDVAMFKSALPSLIRQPGGNKMITATLRAMANDRIKRADIADQVFTGDLTVPEAMRKMRALPSPLARFQESTEGKSLLKGISGAQPAAAAKPTMRLRFNPKTNALEPVQ